MPASQSAALGVTMIDWNDLDRAERNAMQCLYGGGSLRNCDPATILHLRQLGLIEGKDRRQRLSALGWELMDLTHAQLKTRMGVTASDAG